MPKKKPYKRPAKSPVVMPQRVIELTDRERDVLAAFAYGKTYAEIAEELRLSPKTVGSYLQRVREKSRAKNRADLIQLALREGLLKTM